MGRSCGGVEGPRARVQHNNGCRQDMDTFLLRPSDRWRLWLGTETGRGTSDEVQRADPLCVSEVASMPLSDLNGVPHACGVGCGYSLHTSCIPLCCGSLLLSADGRGSLGSTYGTRTRSHFRKFCVVLYSETCGSQQFLSSRHLCDERFSSLTTTIVPLDICGRKLPFIAFVEFLKILSGGCNLGKPQSERLASSAP